MLSTVLDAIVPFVVGVMGVGGVWLLIAVAKNRQSRTASRRRHGVATTRDGA